MGTSSARRAPTTAWWRAAKGAATRYLSPSGGGEVTAREVAARYVAALGEGAAQADPSGLAAWRLTRKAAQNLGAFWAETASTGRDAAFHPWGSGRMSPPSRESPAHGLSAALVPSDGGLEEVVARTALFTVLATVLPSCLAPRDRPAGTPEPAQLVRRFLATALFLRLNLDLGESMEAAADSASRLRAGLEGIRRQMEQAATLSEPAGPGPQAPGDWRGWPGWSWVSETLKTLLQHLGAGRP